MLLKNIKPILAKTSKYLELKSEWLKTWTSIGANIVTIIGLLIAYFTLHTQLKTNEEQSTQFTSSLLQQQKRDSVMTMSFQLQADYYQEQTKLMKKQIETYKATDEKKRQFDSTSFAENIKLVRQNLNQDAELFKYNADLTQPLILVNNPKIDVPINEEADSRILEVKTTNIGQRSAEMVQLKVYILAFQYGQINTLELYDSKEVVYDIIEKERTRENKFMFVTPNKRPIIVICEVNYWDGLIKKKNTFTKYFHKILSVTGDR